MGSEMMECRPLRFRTESGVAVPENPALLNLAEAFFRREFPVAPMPNLSEFARVWVVVEATEGGEPEVIGMTALNQVVDVPLFHSTSPKGLLLMFQRTTGWASDMAIPNLTVFLHPGAETKFRSMMARCSAEPLSRWLFRMDPEIEVE